MKRTVPGLTALVLALAGCSAAGGIPPGSPATSSSPAPSTDGEGGIEHPTGVEEVLVVEETGGLVMVDLLATHLPAFVMYGDGRVIMQGMQTLEFPGPALPALIERTLTERGIQEVLAAVEETELFTTDAELRGASSVIADATDTVFTLNAAGREVTVSVYALGLLDPSMGNLEGVSSAEVEAHATLLQLRDALMTLDTAIGAEGWESEGWQPFQPQGFRLYVRDVTGEPADADLPEQVRDWPAGEGPAAFGEVQEGLAEGTRCGVVEGEAGAMWLAELSAASQMTRWSTDGEDRFSIQARPLLPGDEPSCPELFGA